MGYTFDLLFQAPRKKDVEAGKHKPFTPNAQVFIKNCTQGEAGKTFVSARCASFTELDSEVDRMIRELESIRRSGRGKFSWHLRDWTSLANLRSVIDPGATSGLRRGCSVQ